MGCAPIFAIAITFHPREKSHNRNHVINCRCEWTIQFYNCHLSDFSADTNTNICNCFVWSWKTNLTVAYDGTLVRIFWKGLLMFLHCAVAKRLTHNTCYVFEFRNDNSHIVHPTHRYFSRCLKSYYRNRSLDCTSHVVQYIVKWFQLKIPFHMDRKLLNVLNFCWSD